MGYRTKLDVSDLCRCSCVFSCIRCLSAPCLAIEVLEFFLDGDDDDDVSDDVDQAGDPSCGRGGWPLVLPICSRDIQLRSAPALDVLRSIWWYVIRGQCL